MAMPGMSRQKENAHGSLSVRTSYAYLFIYPLTYFARCFCDSTPSPRPHLATPHSCGNPCTRKRTSCEHPCPLTCHPGPCPPCKITMEIKCGCPRKRPMIIRCSDAQNTEITDTAMSCGERCGRPLACGNPEHRCEMQCHQGECGKCAKREEVKCWCGKTEQEGVCGELGEHWVGKLGCDEEEETNPGYGKGFTCGAVCGVYVMFFLRLCFI